MKKTVKLVSILLIAITLVMSMYTFSTASGQLDPSGVKPTYEVKTDTVKVMAGRILGLIRNVAIIASVVLIAVLGVKYMLGSVEEKAEYKKSFVPLIVGAVVVMAATQIATMIFSLATN